MFSPAQNNDTPVALKSRLCAFQYDGEFICVLQDPAQTPFLSNPVVSLRAFGIEQPWGELLGSLHVHAWQVTEGCLHPPAMNQSKCIGLVHVSNIWVWLLKGTWMALRTGQLRDVAGSYEV